jgi:hypothetical protein
MQGEGTREKQVEENEENKGTKRESKPLFYVSPAPAIFRHALLHN